MRTSLFAFLFAGSVGVVGCGAASEDESGVSESAVRTAQCPDSFALDFESPQLFWSGVQRGNHTPWELSQLFESMNQARARGAFRTVFSLTTKSQGRCSYAVAGVHDAQGFARFETKRGKDQIQIDVGIVRYYLETASYATSGITLADNAVATVHSSISVGHEATDVVRVGSANVRLAETPGAGEIARLAEELAVAIDPLDARRGFDADGLEGPTPWNLLKSFVSKSHGDDEELLGQFTFDPMGTKFVRDEPKAGLFGSPTVAKRAVVEAIGDWYRDRDEEELPDGRTLSVVELQLAAARKLDELTAAGAMFAYDGLRKNGCAAGTSFLVVIDPVAKAASGIDVNPCREP